MDTIFCMNCGRSLPADALRCPDCGAPTLQGAGLTSDEAFETNEIAWFEVAPILEETPAEVPAECVDGQTGVDAQPIGSEASKVLQGIAAVTRRFAQLGSKKKAIVAASVAAALLLVFGIVLAVRSGAGSSAFSQDAVDGQSGDATVAGGSAGVEVRADLADYSWQELSTIAHEMTNRASREEALALAAEYHLVDEQGRMSSQTKDVQITGMNPVPVRLADIYHDNLEGGAGVSGLTFLSTNAVYTHQMKDGEDNSGGWEGSQLRSWLSSDVLPAVDPELRECIRAADKRSNNAGGATSTDAVTSTFDMLWVPSVVEVCGQVAWEWGSDPANNDAYNALLGAEGSQYACFAEMGVVSTEANEGLKLAGAEGPVTWWLRSASPSGGQSYRMVDEEGNPSRWSVAQDQRGVCFGFCL